MIKKIAKLKEKNKKEHKKELKAEKHEDYPVATCTVCGKITEIQQSHAWRSLMAQMKTYQERNHMLNKDVLRIHKAKNAQMYALYKFIGEMYVVLNEDQKAKLLSSKQEMRDAVRRGYNILLGKESKREERKKERRRRRRRVTRITW